MGAARSDSRSSSAGELAEARRARILSQFPIRIDSRQERQDRRAESEDMILSSMIPFPTLRAWRTWRENFRCGLTLTKTAKLARKSSLTNQKILDRMDRINRISDIDQHAQSEEIPDAEISAETSTVKSPFMVRRADALGLLAESFIEQVPQR